MDGIIGSIGHVVDNSTLSLQLLQSKSIKNIDNSIIVSIGLLIAVVIM